MIDENYSQPGFTLFLEHTNDAKQLLLWELSENKMNNRWINVFSVDRPTDRQTNLPMETPTESLKSQYII